MPRQIFVNLAVADLPRSVEFFKGLGFAFDPRFTNAQGSMMHVNDDAKVMLLAKPFFQTFTQKTIADSARTTEVISCFSAENRAAVDDLCQKAFALGGRRCREPQDYGFMYQWAFEDVDGHIFEVVWMDPAKDPTVA